MKQPIRVFVACLIAILPGAVLGQNVVYVDADAIGANDGTSWQNAFTDLQNGIALATAGTQIWVAEGTYRPAGPGGDRTASFVLRPGVEIYGGFLGNETSVDERPSPLAVTTLSGDLLGNDGDEVNLDDPTRGENSFHVVTCAESESDSPSVIDGFTVTGGNSNGTVIDNQRHGGAVHCHERALTVRASLFVRNSADFGGAIFLSGAVVRISSSTFLENNGLAEGGGLWSFLSKVSLDSTKFLSNTGGRGGGWTVRDSQLLAKYLEVVDNSASTGGGLYNRFSDQWIFNSRIIANQARFDGGGLVDDESRTHLVNVAISGNSAETYGGGIWTFDSTLVGINLTIAGNRAKVSGGGVSHWGGIQTYTNTIFAANAAPSDPDVNVHLQIPNIKYQTCPGSAERAGFQPAHPNTVATSRRTSTGADRSC